MFTKSTRMTNYIQLNLLMMENVYYVLIIIDSNKYVINVGREFTKSILTLYVVGTSYAIKYQTKQCYLNKAPKMKMNP